MRELALILAVASLFSGLVWLWLPPVWFSSILAFVAIVFLILGAGRGRVRIMDVGTALLSGTAAVTRLTADLLSHSQTHLLPAEALTRLVLVLYTLLAVIIWIVIWRSVETFRITRRNLQKEEFIVHEDPIHEWTRKAVEKIRGIVPRREEPPPQEIVLDLGEIQRTTRTHEVREL